MFGCARGGNLTFKVNRAALRNRMEIESLRKHLGETRFSFLFQLDYDDLDWFIAGVDVGVHGVGRVCREPIRLAGLPDMGLGGAALFDDLHRSAGHRNDHAGMLMAVHGEACVGKNDGLPDFDVVIFEERNSLRLRGLLGVNDDNKRRREKRAEKKHLHENLRGRIVTHGHTKGGL